MQAILKRYAPGAPFVAGAMLLILAGLAFFNRHGYLVTHDMLPRYLFWDAAVFASAATQVAHGLNPYLGPAITEPISFPFISPPLFTMMLGAVGVVAGKGTFLLLSATHIAALAMAPLIQARLFLGRGLGNALLAYGLVGAGLGALGVTMVITGNFGATLYLLIFAALIPGLKDNKWLWFHAAVIFAAQVKPPYALLWVIPVLVNGWSWRQFRDAAIAGAIGAIPYLVAYLAAPDFFRDWIAALNQQVGRGDIGFSAYGGTIIFNPVLEHTLAPYVVHTLVCAVLLAFLLLDKTKGELKAAALIVFAILANPRMKEYDIAFATIPAAALYLAALPRAWDANMRQAVGLGFLIALSAAMLRIDHVPLLGPYMYTVAMAAAVLCLALSARQDQAIRAPVSAPTG